MKKMTKSLALLLALILSFGGIGVRAAEAANTISGNGAPVVTEESEVPSGMEDPSVPEETEDSSVPEETEAPSVPEDSSAPEETEAPSVPEDPSAPGGEEAGKPGAGWDGVTTNASYEKDGYTVIVTLPSIDKGQHASNHDFISICVVILSRRTSSTPSLSALQMQMKS